MHPSLIPLIKRLDIDDVKSLASKLPLSKSKVIDPVSTELFGVLFHNDKNLSKDTRKKLLHFAIQNIVGYENQIKRFEHRLKNNFEWNKVIDRFLYNPGQITEYFVVDFLKRNPLRHSHDIEGSIKDYVISHTKGAPEQDEIEKIDFLSTLTSIKTKKKVNIGIQLTTHTMHQKTYEKQKDKNYTFMTGSSKKQKIQEISQAIRPHTKKSPYDKKYSPDIMGYMVINGGIDTRLNKEKHNFPAQAFETWKSNGFPHGGPTQYISKDLRTLFEIIAYHHQISLIKMLQGLQEKCKNNDFTYVKKMYEKHTIQYIETYKPEQNELLFEFFKKDPQTQESNLLFSICYFINQHVKNIVEQSIRK